MRRNLQVLDYLSLHETFEIYIWLLLLFRDDWRLLGLVGLHVSEIEQTTCIYWGCLLSRCTSENVIESLLGLLFFGRIGVIDVHVCKLVIHGGLTHGSCEGVIS